MEVEVTPNLLFHSSMLVNITDEDRKLFIDNNDTYEFSRFSCHSQAVERKPCVGFLRVRINSHEIISHFYYKRPEKVASYNIKFL